MSIEAKTIRVSLVITPDRALQDFPAKISKRRHSALLEASYSVSIGPGGIDPSTNKFAAWLASEIATTNFSDDASRLTLVRSFTNGQAYIKEMLERTCQVAHGSFEKSLDFLEASLERQRQIVSTYGADSLNRLVVERFDWPVYGVSFDSPEQYFTYCAGCIRRMGAVPVAAGLSGSRPEPSLLRTFANGAGLDLVDRYDRERLELAA